MQQPNNGQRFSYQCTLNALHTQFLSSFYEVTLRADFHFISVCLHLYVWGLEMRRHQ